MLIIMNEDMIQTLPPQTAHEPFTNPIRLGCSKRRFHFFDTPGYC